jgi:hypothetical protein
VLPDFLNERRAKAIYASASAYTAPALPARTVRAGSNRVIEKVTVVEGRTLWPERGFSGVAVASATAA